MQVKKGNCKDDFASISKDGLKLGEEGKMLSQPLLSPSFGACEYGVTIATVASSSSVVLFIRAQEYRGLCAWTAEYLLATVP